MTQMQISHVTTQGLADLLGQGTLLQVIDQPGSGQRIHVLHHEGEDLLIVTGTGEISIVVKNAANDAGIHARARADLLKAFLPPGAGLLAQDDDDE